MNYAILLAGGSGSRIASAVPKQYLEAGGHRMVTYALKPLLSCGLIDAVYVVAEDEWRDVIASDAKDAGLSTEKIKGYAQPGKNRQTSIVNGMREILCAGDETAELSAMYDEDTVLIHDAARPFLSERMLTDCYAALPGYDGVMPALPMKDTVYLSEDGVLATGLLDRASVYAGQAPELFCLKAYFAANTALLPEKIFSINGASEPALLAGLKIKMIAGDENNHKITTAEDLKRFFHIIEGGAA